MKNSKLKVFGLACGLFLLPAIALAFTIENGNSIFVDEQTVIEGNYYSAGTSITIDGHVTGDVICAGQSIVINGTVDGDVICAGQSVSANGEIGGSLRVVASDINIRGTVERSLSVAAANVNIEKSAYIGWDANIAAANVQIRGEVGRSLLGAGANYVLGGRIGEDVKLYLDNNTKRKEAELRVDDLAEIGGGLDYTSRATASISDQAQIEGEVVHKLPAMRHARSSSQNGYLALMIMAMLSALVVGLIIIKIFKEHIVELSESMVEKFWPALGWGFVVTVVTPMVSLLLAITVVGARLALIIMLAWLIILMLAKIVASIAIGRLLVRNYWVNKKDSLTTAMAVGIFLSWLVFYIPVIGWLASAVAMWWGVGGLVGYLKKA